MRPRRTKGKVSAKVQMATQKAFSLVAANKGAECLPQSTMITDDRRGLQSS